MQDQAHKHSLTKNEDTVASIKWMFSHLLCSYFPVLQAWNLDETGCNSISISQKKCLRHANICCCWVTKSCPTFCDPHGLQHARLPGPSVSPGVCPLSQWCLPSTSSSVAPFSFPQSFQHHSLFQWVSCSHQMINYWKNHSFDYKDLCCQSDITAF